MDKAQKIKEIIEEQKLLLKEIKDCDCEETISINSLRIRNLEIKKNTIAASSAMNFPER